MPLNALPGCAHIVTRSDGTGKAIRRLEQRGDGFGEARGQPNVARLASDSVELFGDACNRTALRDVHEWFMKVVEMRVDMRRWNREAAGAAYEDAIRCVMIKYLEKLFHGSKAAGCTQVERRLQDAW